MANNNVVHLVQLEDVAVKQTVTMPRELGK
jgi:hypothetical protein